MSRPGHTFRFIRQIGAQKSRDTHGCPGMNGMFVPNWNPYASNPSNAVGPSLFDSFGLQQALSVFHTYCDAIEIDQFHLAQFIQNCGYELA